MIATPAALALMTGTLVAASSSNLPPSAVARFADLALACLHREYPNKIAHVLTSDADARPPRELTPAFFGCYDWHSAVHGHWLLARLARLYPDAAFAGQARSALGRSLTGANLAREAEYLRGEGRNAFERPYGLAWLLQLHAELREWDDADAKRWASALDPLVGEAAKRLASWLPRLTRPIRVGEHTQTAFAFGLILDWARTTGDEAMARLIDERSRVFYEADRECPLAYEPSGHDFLSPCLAEADLMRRLLPQADFVRWLRAFLPRLPVDGGDTWLEPGVVTDPTDGHLVHLHGLNLSRAWMLEGMAAALPADDARRPGLAAAASRHREAGLTAVTGDHYEGGHWLGTFAVYLVTSRGLPGAASRP